MNSSPQSQRKPSRHFCPWSTAELESVVALYFYMRTLQRLGRLGRGKGKTTKKELMVSWLKANAPDRGLGAVKLKLQNITASFHWLHLPGTVRGFCPLNHRPKTLDRIVSETARKLEGGGL